jgi:hypothetical protein
MCRHARVSFFCPEGRKSPEPIAEVWCREPGCTHHWLLVGATESPTIREKMELRDELKLLLAEGPMFPRRNER